MPKFEPAENNSVDAFLFEGGAENGTMAEEWLKNLGFWSCYSGVNEAILDEAGQVIFAGTPERIVVESVPDNPKDVQFVPVGHYLVHSNTHGLNYVEKNFFESGYNQCLSYNEGTLEKVHQALVNEGVADELERNDIINSMQKMGILFRERI